MIIYIIITILLDFVMLNLIKIAAKLALKNPKIRNEVKKAGIKSYTKAKPIISKNLKILKDTVNQVDPLENPKLFGKKLKENFKK